MKHVKKEQISENDQVKSSSCIVGNEEFGISFLKDEGVSILFAKMICLFLLCGQVQALQFNFSYHNSIPPESLPHIQPAVEAAGERWASILHDDVTVNISIRYNARLGSSKGSLHIHHVFRLPL